MVASQWFRVATYNRRQIIICKAEEEQGGKIEEGNKEDNMEQIEDNMEEL